MPGEGEATIESQHAEMAVEMEAVEAVEVAAVEEEAIQISNFTMAHAMATVRCNSSGVMRHVVSLHAARSCKNPTMKAA